MKLSKKLFAVIVAVLLIAAMVIPCAAAAIPATNNNTLTINGKKGFTASVYKIADFNTATGAFTEAKSTAVETALKAGYTGTVYNPDAALLAAADALTATQLGDAVKTKAFSADGSETWNDLAAGVYYVKWTGTPSNVTKAQNSVFAVPYFSGDAWVQTVTISDSKVDTGDISFDKKFADSAEQNREVVTRSVGDNVNFVLTGSVPGSSETPATALWFDDTMTGGLIFNSSIPVVVKGTKDSGNPVDLTVSTDYTLSSTDEYAKNFKISFDETQISSLYTKQITGIRITYTAKLTAESVVIAGNGNPNTLDYHYESSAGSYNGSRTKIVKTYELKVKKVDANDNSIALGNASFKLYKDSVADANLIAEKTTASSGSNKGYATFSGLNNGTYVVVESVAPGGYALNTKEFSVKITDGAVTGNNVDNNVLIVPDPKVVLPNTGGTGTLLFTIGGILLIAGAAVLLVIYKKKSANK